MQAVGHVIGVRMFSNAPAVGMALLSAHTELAQLSAWPM
jgi:hypothetical protein